MSGVSSKHETRASWQLPVFLRSFGVVAGTLFIFFLAQILSVFFIALVLGTAGWNTDRISNWVSDTTTGQFTLMLLIEAVTILGVWFTLGVIRKKWSALRLKNKFTRPDIMAIVAGLAAYFAFSFIVRVIVSLAIPTVNLEQSQQIGFEDASGASLVLVFLGLCVAVPLAEEVLFRGLLFNGLKRYLGLGAAWVTTSLVFGALHLEFLGDNPLNWAAAIETAVFSAVLIWVYQKRDNLWAPIGLHALKNTVAFIFLFILKVQ